MYIYIYEKGHHRADVKIWQKIRQTEQRMSKRKKSNYEPSAISSHSITISGNPTYFSGQPKTIYIYLSKTVANLQQQNIT